MCIPLHQRSKIGKVGGEGEEVWTGKLRNDATTEGATHEGVGYLSCVGRRAEKETVDHRVPREKD